MLSMAKGTDNIKAHPRVLIYRYALLYAAAPFFALFFIPIPGGFDCNMIAIMALFLLGISYVSRILNNVWLMVGVLIPWLGSFFLFLLAESFLGLRLSFGQFIPQIIFMFAAIGMGFGLSDMIDRPNGAKHLLYLSAITVVSYASALIISAPIQYLLGLFTGITKLSPIEVIFYSRRVFQPANFANGSIQEFVVNYHNRIAQHNAAHGIMIITLAALAGRIAPRYRVLSSALIICGLAMCALALMLLSGQSLASLVIAGMICAYGLALYRLSIGLIIVSFIGISVAIGAIILLSQTDLYAIWSARFSGGDISTGRFDRWLWVFSESGRYTLLGLENSNNTDPHNMMVTLFFELGPFGGLLTIAFLIALLAPVLLCLKKIAIFYGVPGLIAISTGPQIALSIMIAGGWGFPGWAEWSKLPLLILILQLVPLPKLQNGVRKKYVPAATKLD